MCSLIITHRSAALLTDLPGLIHQPPLSILYHDILPCYIEPSTFNFSWIMETLLLRTQWLWSYVLSWTHVWCQMLLQAQKKVPDLHSNLELKEYISTAQRTELLRSWYACNHVGKGFLVLLKLINVHSSHDFNIVSYLKHNSCTFFAKWPSG